MHCPQISAEAAATSVGVERWASVFYKQIRLLLVEEFGICISFGDVMYQFYSAIRQLRRTS